MSPHVYVPLWTMANMTVYLYVPCVLGSLVTSRYRDRSQSGRGQETGAGEGANLYRLVENGQAGGGLSRP